MNSASRGLPCSLAAPLPPSALALLRDFRLLVNSGVREALLTGVTSRGSLVSLSQRLAREHRVHGSHARLAMDLALALTKGHRRRLRLGRPSTVPFVRTPCLVADDATFHLDPVSGHLRLSLRNGEWAGIDLRLSDYHRARLATETVKQLRLRPDRATLILDRCLPGPYAPKSLLALDTNERSLDGVLANRSRTIPVVVPFPEVATVQHRHFVRRRKLGRKKAHDRRVGRRLGGREGRRERNRVTQRLHLVSKGLVKEAARRKAVLALEDLHVPASLGRSRRARRRLSSWPRRELHRQISYKAEELGVPILWVDPAYTSRSCPACGVISERRRRMGTTFRCGACGWTGDRQLAAGLNIGRTALAELPEGAMKLGLGGLRLAPDALAKDGMRLLYPRVAAGGTGGPDGQGVLRAPTHRRRAF